MSNTFTTPFMYGIADGEGNAYFEEGCVAPEAKHLQPEVDGINSCLDEDEKPYRVVPLYALANHEISKAALDVLAERNRQIHTEGWTPEHDDQHYTGGELSDAAVAYALEPYCCSKSNPPAPWPWSKDWWKPSTPRRDLIKAAALLIAEIERLDRATAQEQAA